MRWQVTAKIKTKRPDERRKEILAAIFKSRGLVTANARKIFLAPKPPDELTARELGIAKPELNKAVRRINRAIEKKENIIVLWRL